VGNSKVTERSHFTPKQSSGSGDLEDATIFVADLPSKHDIYLLGGHTHTYTKLRKSKLHTECPHWIKKSQ
jgi:hypothetical protein